jgi:hypothetical protein
VDSLPNAHKKMKNNRVSEEVLEKVDWSAANDDFQICIASLEGNIDKFVELMPKVRQSSMIEKSSYREWPVFDWVRNEKAVGEKFQEIYGEPLLKAASENEVIDEEKSS